MSVLNFMPAFCSHRYGVTASIAFPLVFRRELTIYRRESVAAIVRVAITIIIAFFCGSLFYDLDKPAKNGKITLLDTINSGNLFINLAY